MEQHSVWIPFILDAPNTHVDIVEIVNFWPFSLHVCEGVWVKCPNLHDLTCTHTHIHLAVSVFVCDYILFWHLITLNRCVFLSRFRSFQLPLCVCVYLCLTIVLSYSWQKWSDGIQPNIVGVNVKNLLQHTHTHTEYIVETEKWRWKKHQGAEEGKKSEKVD